MIKYYTYLVSETNQLAQAEKCTMSSIREMDLSAQTIKRSGRSTDYGRTRVNLYVRSAFFFGQ